MSVDRRRMNLTGGDVGVMSDSTKKTDGVRKGCKSVKCIVRMEVKYVKYLPVRSWSSSNMKLKVHEHPQVIHGQK